MAIILEIILVYKGYKKDKEEKILKDKEIAKQMYD